jgi:NAD/NADP transhydrogenase beta subunit
MPIGGADMPVVISLLNSFTGVAAATGGFLYNNQAMLTGGILVGSAGTILTILMCKAMNRSLGYRARIRNHGHSCFLCEIVIRSQFHTTYEPEA